MASEHDQTPTVATDGDVTAGSLSTQADQTEGAAPAPARRTRKAAVKKVAAPRKRAAAKKTTAAVSPPAEALTLPDGAPEVAPAPDASGAVETGVDPVADQAVVPAKKATRKRASRKAAAPAAAPQQSALPLAAEASEASEAPSAAVAADVPQPASEPSPESATVAPPAPRRTRRSSTRTTPEAPTSPDALTSPEALAAPEPLLEVTPEPEARGPEPRSDDTDPAAPSAFGLVFQPPAPAGRRRRRASAPVGQPVIEPEPTAVSAPSGEAPAPEAARSAATGADAVTPEEPSTLTGVDQTGDETSEITTGTLTTDGAADAVTGLVGSETDDSETDDDETSSTDDVDDEAGDEAGDEGPEQPRRRRRRGGKGRRGRGGAPGDETAAGAGASSGGGAGTRRSASAPAADAADAADAGAAEAGRVDEGSDEGADDGPSDVDPGEGGGSSRRRTRRRRRSGGGSADPEDAPNVVTRVREPRRQSDEVTGVKGSTRLEAKKQRRREGREAGRRRTVITEAEFLARRESVERIMVVRNKDDRTQIGVLEDDVLVEHYISRETNVSMAGNIYLGRVQNVLPSMEAAFVDIGKGRNAVLYAGEVNWDAAGLEHGSAKRIENALGSGQSVLVQVTKDPIGHKGARLTSQISLPGRYLVYVPDSSMTGISRKLPDTERARLKKILKDVVPESAGVIVRTAAEGASEEELRADVERLTRTWEEIQAKVEAAGGATSKAKGKAKGGSAPVLLHGEPDLTVRVIRDVFNEDFGSLVVAGEQAWDEVSSYVDSVAPDLAARVTRWTSEEDLFTHYRIDEQLAKAMDRKVWLPSGGSLVIDRTEAMTVIDVNTGKFVGSGGNLEETVTKNNIEAAEEIVRQLRVRDIGGIIVVDFIDMVLEANRDLVVRRLLECLGRDRTKHQVAEVTSLGLVQMTRKRVGSGLIEVFSENCEHCAGRGIIVHTDPVDRSGGSGGSLPSQVGGGSGGEQSGSTRAPRARRGRGEPEPAPVRSGGPTPAQIAAAAHAAAIKAAEATARTELADDAPYGDLPHAVEGPAADAADAVDGAEVLDLEAPEAADAVVSDEVATSGVAADLAAAVEHAVEQAVAQALSTGAVDEAPADTDAQPQARQGRQRQPRRSRSGRGAPESAPEAATTTGPDAGEPAAPSAAPQAVEPTPDDAPEPPAAARGRRRRGRVVAPAGPPRAAGDEAQAGGPDAGPGSGSPV